MNIFVTGAAGFIGSHVCEDFLKKGHTVVGLDNMNQYYDPEIKKANLIEIEKTADRVGQDFIFYVGDIRHQDQIRQIYQEHKIGAVIHLAGLPGVRASINDPRLYTDVNQMGTINLLEEAYKLKIRDVIFASSSSVYGNNKKIPFCEDDSVDFPISHYAATKKAGEISCHVYHKVHGLSVACLRFFTVYGARQRPDLAIHKFTRLILEGKKIPVYGDGSKKRDYTYIDDIIDGVSRALEWTRASAEPRYGIFNLGESQTVSVNDLVTLLSQITGKPVDRQTLPDQPGDVEITYADISRARDILGYDPKTKLADGLVKFVEWMRNSKIFGSSIK